jgi:adenylate cyclase
LYGTPVPLENPTFSAVQTAIQIQKQLEIKMPEWVASGFPEYQVGIGINFQEVVVGNVGSERLSNFTAIGDGVNIASRLCSVAGAGEILVSESCFEQLTDLREGMEKRTGIKIKGKEEPITVYALYDSLSRPALCPECSGALPPEMKFCGSCGYKQF